MNEKMIERFFNWINERHMIYLRYKVDGDSWPWTEDKILQEYKFTNVFRELDTGTIWLRENWLEPFHDHPKLFFNICLYRQFNWWPTAEFLGFAIEPHSAIPDLWDGKTIDWRSEEHTSELQSH